MSRFGHNQLMPADCETASRIATAAAALAAYGAWVDADAAAYLSGQPRPHLDLDVAERLAQCAEAVLEAAGVPVPPPAG